MDTKLNNTMQNSQNDKERDPQKESSNGILKFNALKILTVILSVVCLTAGVMLLYQTAQYDLKTFRLSGCLGEKNYLDSDQLRNDFYDASSGLEALSARDTSEKEIREGKWLNSQIEEYKLSLLEEDRDRFGLWENELETAEENQSQSEKKETKPTTVIDIINSEAFLKRHQTEIDDYRNEMIENELNDYQSLIAGVKVLEREDGLQWIYEKDGQTQRSSSQITEEGLKKQKVWGEINNGQISGSIQLNSTAIEQLSSDSIDKASRIVFAFSDEKIESLMTLYDADHQTATKAVQNAMALFVFGLVLFLGACLAAGKQPGTDEVVLSPFDRVYWDLHFILAVTVISILLSGGVTALVINLPWMIAALLIALSVLCVETFLLSLVRIIKAGKFMDRFGLMVLCKKLWHLCQKVGAGLSQYYYQVMKGRSLVLKVMFWALICVVSGILVIFLPFIGIVIAALLIWFAGKKAKNLDQVIQGIQKIYGGDSDYRIEVTGEGTIEDMARQINQLHDGMDSMVKNAVEKELRSERLKTELITNVSHDIRTPLTSIIAYIDLLKQSDLDEESRERYLEILETKAARLKALTDDLFEAAKASTGNIEVHAAPVNLEALVDQGMGELEDKLKASGLEFVITRPEEKVIVNADGRLLWRVIENLLSNVTKYAMPQSRVYITIEKDDKNQQGILTIKNISAAPLNIPPEELMERFKRGDDSRHNEGSGLGLSIARDLTKLQQGQFNLEIDGDLFKAIVVLKSFQK